MSSARIVKKYFVQHLPYVVHSSRCLKYISNKTKIPAFLELPFGGLEGRETVILIMFKTTGETKWTKQGWELEREWVVALN